MCTLVWNCRGVGNRRTVQELLALASGSNPKLVFLRDQTIGGECIPLEVEIGFTWL